MKKNIHIIIICIFLIFVKCQGLPNLGGGYKFDYNSTGDLSIIDDKNTYIIYGHILEYKINSEFIVASERPRNVIPECTGTIKGSTLKECDEAFEKSTFRQYWIINKTNDSIYGPLNKEDYEIVFKNLAIPKELKLLETN